MHRWFLVAAAVVLSIHSVGAQTELKWKWQEKDQFFVQTQSQIQQTLIVADPRVPNKKPDASDANDREVRQQFRHTVVLGYTVRKVNADGSAELVQKIENLLIKGDAERRDLVLTGEASRAGASLVLYVTAEGEITKVEGQKQLLELLIGNDSTRKEAMTAALSEDALKRNATLAFGFLPKTKVKEGETWSRKADLLLGAAGVLEVEHTFTSAGAAKENDHKGQEKLSSKTKVLRFEPAKVANLAFQVTEGKITCEGTGTIFFDGERGRLVQATTNLKLDGNMTIKNVDTTYRLKVTQEHSIETSLLDKLPKP